MSSSERQRKCAVNTTVERPLLSVVSFHLVFKSFQLADTEKALTAKNIQIISPVFIHIQWKLFSVHFLRKRFRYWKANLSLLHNHWMGQLPAPPPPPPPPEFQQQTARCSSYTDIHRQLLTSEKKGFAYLNDAQNLYSCITEITILSGASILSLQWHPKPNANTQRRPTWNGIRAQLSAPTFNWELCAFPCSF